LNVAVDALPSDSLDGAFLRRIKDEEAIVYESY
jgi:hypothetical protein